MTSNDQIECARKNPDCYDEQGGYVGPGTELYGSTQTVDSDGVPLVMAETERRENGGKAKVAVEYGTYGERHGCESTDR